jgi:hypothetical protein
LDHSAIEIALEIKNVKRKVELVRNSTSVVTVVERSTTRRQRVAIFVSINAATLIPELHRKTDHFVTRLF